MTISNQTASRRHYTVALSKGAAVLAEMRTLLMHWVPGESDKELLERVQKGDLLGKQTHQRAADLVKRVFKPRLLVEDGRPARWLKHYMMRNANVEAFREMMFVYTARAEDLLYDFMVERFWALVRHGDLYISHDDIISFLNEATEKKQIAKAWSQHVQIRFARSLLGALQDFGFIHGDRKGRRELINYRITDIGVAYLIHELHFRGFSDAAVVEHPDWGLFGLERTRVLERLEALDPTAGLVVQRAGSVVRITWAFPSMEAWIDAISR